MTGWSNGNSFSGSSNFSEGNSFSIAAGSRVPPWKFGVGPASMSDCRGGM
jgi:hypothetical protein